MANPNYAVLIDGGFVKYTLKSKRADPPTDDKAVGAFVDAIGTSCRLWHTTICIVCISMTRDR